MNLFSGSSAAFAAGTTDAVMFSSLLICMQLSGHSLKSSMKFADPSSLMSLASKWIQLSQAIDERNSSPELILQRHDNTYKMKKLNEFILTLIKKIYLKLSMQ